MSYTQEEHNDDEGLDDSEMLDVGDVSDEDSSELIPCPYCQKPVYEQVEICPHCGSYISREDSPRRHPPWVIITILSTLVAVVLFCVFRRG